MNYIELLRQYKIAGYALFDIALSFIGIYLLAPFLSKLFLKIGIIITRKSWLFLTLPLGIIFHLLFRQATPMTQDFFDPSGHYVLKIVIIILTVLGLKDVRLAKEKA